MNAYPMRKICTLRASARLSTICIGTFTACLWVEDTNAIPSSQTPDRFGFSAAIGTGLNVTRPFGTLELGRRLQSADFFEPYVGYSYNAAVSEFPFHVMGLGVRTYFLTWPRVEVFHQAYLGTALSGGGSTDVPERDLGERMLGAFVTQGLGAQVLLGSGFSLALTCETGYPVWLRSTLAVNYLY